jgi:pantoate kinase
MNLIEEILKNPQAIQIVRCSHRFSLEEGLNVYSYPKVKQEIYRDITKRIASYLVKNNLIMFDEEENNGETTIHAKLYVIDFNKLKKE